MDTLLAYGLRVSASLIVLTTLFLLVPRKLIGLRLAVLLFGFIVLRDAMTPLGLWEFDKTDSYVPWVRFIDDGLILAVLGFISLIITVAVVKASPKLATFIKWGRLNLATVITGATGAAIVAVPFLLIYQFVPIEHRGGEVAFSLLLPLLMLALFGNFMEEVLFRGFLQGYLDTFTSIAKSTLLSGLFFAAGHVFLATTVTDVGWTLLAFTLYEGIICALVRNKAGVFGSTITHGLAIFVLASGVF